MSVCWISDSLSALADVWNFPLYLNNILRTNRKRWDIFKMRHHFCTGDKQTCSQTRQQRSAIEIPDLWEEELEENRKFQLFKEYYSQITSVRLKCVHCVLLHTEHKTTFKKKRKKQTSSWVIVFLNGNIPVSAKQSWKILQEIHSSCCNHNSTVNVS